MIKMDFDSVPIRKTCRLLMCYTYCTCHRSVYNIYASPFMPAVVAELALKPSYQQLLFFCKVCQVCDRQTRQKDDISAELLTMSFLPCIKHESTKV